MGPPAEVFLASLRPRLLSFFLEFDGVETIQFMKLHEGATSMAPFFQLKRNTTLCSMIGDFLHLEVETNVCLSGTVVDMKQTTTRKIEAAAFLDGGLVLS